MKCPKCGGKMIRVPLPLWCKIGLHLYFLELFLMDIILHIIFSPLLAYKGMKKEFEKDYKIKLWKFKK